MSNYITLKKKVKEKEKVSLFYDSCGQLKKKKKKAFPF